MPMNNPELTPGKKLSDREKAALEKDNHRETMMAQEQAAKQREVDIRNGNNRPVVNTVADSILDKLKRGEFKTK